MKRIFLSALHFERQQWWLLVPVLAVAFLPDMFREGVTRWATIGAVMTIAASALAFAICGMRARIETNAEAISLDSALPPYLAWLRPSWRIRWDQIHSVQLEPGRGALRNVRIRGAGFDKRIMIGMWFESREQMLQWRKVAAANAFKRSGDGYCFMLPLAALFVEHGFLTLPAEASADATGFDLAGHKPTKWVLIVTAVTAAYWLADATVTDQMYGSYVPWTAMSLIGAIVGVAASIFLVVKRAPSAESIAVGAIAGLTVFLASYTGLQRGNQLVDPAGTEITLTLSRAKVLVPESKASRDLAALVNGDPPFWSAQPAGATYVFRAHDGLWFTTYDIGAYRQLLKEHYGRDPGWQFKR
jgi:hypothetical protein